MSLSCCTCFCGGLELARCFSRGLLDISQHPFASLARGLMEVAACRSRKLLGGSSKYFTFCATTLGGFGYFTLCARLGVTVRCRKDAHQPRVLSHLQVLPHKSNILICKSPHNSPPPPPPFTFHM
ncbi:hypothetical protein B566_EDAN014890 [Ephemera danica]|nr:hypothetical protein B566_EDAN014890 [Ephemera danica]